MKKDGECGDGESKVPQPSSLGLYKQNLPNRRVGKGRITIGVAFQRTICVSPDMLPAIAHFFDCTRRRKDYFCISAFDSWGEYERGDETDYGQVSDVERARLSVDCYCLC